MPQNSLTIIMYHYIRDLKNSDYPKIKGLDTTLFLEQLEYLSRHYTVIDAKDLARGVELPPRATLLTFDDGYIDHYLTAFFALRKRNMTGVFAPVVDACLRGRVLDVNKVHFILVSVADVGLLVRAIDAVVAEREKVLGFTGPGYRATMIKRRFDTLEVSYVKDMLQKRLPPDLRTQVTEDLFTRYVSADEADFASSLYMSREQLGEMHEAGMSLSIHGSTHRWLSTLASEEQEREITESLDFLEGLGASRSDISISYPYGDYNDETLTIVRRHGIGLGFTVRQATARLPEDDLLTLPRFDTNDIPKNRNAEAPVNT